MTEPNGKFQPELYRNYLLILAHALLHSQPKLKNRFDASDFVQDALLKAHKKLNTFRGDHQNFTAWLRRILKNIVLDAARKHCPEIDKEIERPICESFDNSSERLLTLIPANSASPSQDIIQARYVADRLAALNSNQRMVLLLYYLLGCSVPEIAQKMNTSKPAVAGLIRRGLEKLREPPTID